jgi:acyl transferase domain-containing protein
VGHSSGEIGAAYATGILTIGEAILCAYFRGFVTQTLSREGSMAAIGLSYQEVQSYLAEGAEIACENSPSSVTISGDPRAVGKTLEAINSKDSEIFTRLLHVNVAYHSSKIPPLLFIPTNID